jgi:hypothetical protein
MVTTEIPTLPDDGGNALVTRSSRGLATAADRLHQTAQDALEHPRHLRLATGQLVRSLRTLRTDAISTRLAWTESEDGGIRDDLLAGLARQLEQYLDKLIPEAEQLDQAAQRPGGDDAARPDLLDLADKILTLKLWLGQPRGSAS